MPITGVVACASPVPNAAVPIADVASATAPIMTPTTDRVIPRVFTGPMLAGYGGTVAVGTADVAAFRLFG